MRITIIGGYLGAGKTTLLNRILASEYARDAVVLVNDFGAVSIDSRLVAAHASRLITLANGCICCSIGNNFVATLIRITRQPSLPRRLIIEASGVADPAMVAEFAATDPCFTLEAVPVLVDAECFWSQRTDPRIGDLVRRQLAAADLIVLNKVDLVPDSEAGKLAAWLTSHFPRRPVIRARDAGVQLAVLFEDVPVHTPRRLAATVPPDSEAEALFESFVFCTHRPVRCFPARVRDRQPALQRRARQGAGAVERR